MTTPTGAHASLTNPGDLIAAIPSLVGFVPVDSLVVITNRAGPTYEVGVVMRVDLPPKNQYQDLVRALLPPIQEQRATAATLVVVGGGHDHRWYRGLIGVLRQGFADVGVSVPHAFWIAQIAADQPWWCVEEDACHGTVPDPRSTPLAATLAATGSVVYRTREELAALIVQDPPEEQRRRRALMHASGDGPTDTASAVAAMRLVDAAAGAVRERELSDTEIVALAAAIGRPEVRDAVLLGGSEDDDLALRELWLRLTRALPAESGADAACLLGLSAYLTGEGALAGIALERAAEVDPAHQLTALVSSALRSGVAPFTMRAMLADLVASARETIVRAEAG